MNKIDITKWLAIGLAAADYVANKIKSGDWKGRFRRNTKEAIEALEESTIELANGVEANARINVELVARIEELERKLLG